MSKIFIDANILLDILISSRPNHQRAVEVYSIVCDRYDLLATSENIITTIEYIASRHGTKCNKIWSFFDGLRRNFEIYDFGKVFDSALEVYHDACIGDTKIDFEDILQLQSAIYNGCDLFLTEDKGIVSSKIEIVDLDGVRGMR